MLIIFTPIKGARVDVIALFAKYHFVRIDRERGNCACLLWRCVFIFIFIFFFFPCIFALFLAYNNLSLDEVAEEGYEGYP